ncbi:choice-of-anchor D domain-containing protein [Haloferula sargassicola]|uniref:Choice-of-anchor D domain-containing protein n=1 Tax=Haloferula sargassicola TaxID=490096 RepID=A0ABP9USL2_9BACT
MHLQADVVRESYVKSVSPGANDSFGYSVAVSGDSAIVGAYLEASAFLDPADDSAFNAGAAYIYLRDAGGAWSSQAYLKPNHVDADDRFGCSVAISGDLAVVGAYLEDSASRSIDGDETSNAAESSGAAYVFVRDGGGNWSQEAYLKASNGEAGDMFGWSVAISGNKVLVGAPLESGGSSGVGGDDSDNSLPQAGAAYLFERDSAGNWSQVAYLKASNPGEGDRFGSAVAIDSTLAAVGANSEDGTSAGVNPDGTLNGKTDSGAVYVFHESMPGTWTADAYLKASNPDAGDWFGYSVSISGTGLIVGAPLESSWSTGINGDETNNSVGASGAAYLFERDSGGTWSQHTYLKASNAAGNDQFGISVSLSGNLAIVGAHFEDGNSTVVDGDETNNDKINAGAAYSFLRLTDGTWLQQSYLKSADNSANSTFGDNFGISVAVSDGIGIVGAWREDSAAAGVNGNPADNSLTDAGAAYTFSLPTELVAPEVAVTVSPDDEPVEHYGYVDLGTTRAGGNTASRVFTITNAGNATLADLNISLSPSSSNQFNLDTSGLPTVLAPGDSADFEVQFYSTSTGSFSGEILIASNDPVADPFYIAVYAQSGEPAISVTNSTGDSLSSGFSRLDFGPQPAGGTSAAETLTVHNDGNVTLTFWGVFLNGANPDDFTIDLDGFPATLEPGGSAGLPIRFQPSATGSSQADLLITSDAGFGGSWFQIGLQGTGTSVEIDVASPPGVSLPSGTSTVDFGDAYLGAPPTNRMFTVESQGGAPLTGVQVEISGANATEFTIMAPGAPDTIEPGGSADFYVSFSPNTVGTHSATLEIVSNDPDESPYQIALTASTINPELEVHDISGMTVENGAFLDFGEARVGSVQFPGEPVTKDFTITNPGTSELILLNADLGTLGPGYSIQKPVLPHAIAPGGSAVISITFSPSATGIQHGSLTLATNDLDENPWVVQFDGVGVAPLLVLRDPTGQDLPEFGSYDFGEISVGSPSAAKTFTVSNEGTTGLTIDLLTLAENDDFVLVTNSLPAVLPPGQSGAFSIRFVPQDGGVRSSSFSLTTDDNSRPLFTAFLTGTGAAPEIDVQSPPGTSLGSGGPAVDFGSLPAGSASFTEISFVVENVGLEPLSRLTASVAGTDPGDFAADATGLPSILAPGASAIVRVRFSPAAAGLRTAELRVASNDADENPFVIALAGTGDAPRISVSVPPGPPLESGATVVDFGQGLVDTANPPMSFVVTNDGTAALSGLTVGVEGPDADNFVVSPPAATSLAAGENTSFEVSLTTTATGVRTATLRITAAEASAPPFLIPLTGVGVAPDLEVSTTADGVLTPGISVVDFGPVPLETTGGPVVFTVKNPGSHPLEALELSLTGPGDHQLNNLGFPATLGPGAEASFSIIFTPSTAGSRQSVLHVISSVADKSPFDVVLIGTGAVPEISLSEAAGPALETNSTISFGSVRTGQSSAADGFTVTNTGDAPLEAVSVQLSGAHAGDFILEATGVPATIAPGASSGFGVSFSPSATGPRAATLEIFSSDADENPFVLQLTGNGVAPEIRVTDSDGQEVAFEGPGLDFGGVNLGAPTSLAVTVHNDGSMDLSGLSVSLTGPDTAEMFLEETGFPVVLAPGASAEIVITFAPVSEGSKSVVLHITSDDDDESPFAIPISAAGLSPEIEIFTEEGFLTSGGAPTDLGDAVVGMAGAPLRFTVTNAGTGILSALSIQTTGSHPADFSVSSDAWSQALAPGETNTFDLTFVPTSAGTRDAVIRVTSNDADENPFLIEVTAEGLAPDIAITLAPDIDLASEGPALSFGELRPGSPAVAKSFLIANIGTSPLHGVSLAMVGGEAGDFPLEASWVPATIAPGDSHPFTISFLPSAGGSRTAELIVTSDDPDESPFLVRVAGVGVEPEIGVLEDGAGELQNGANLLGFGAVLLGNQGETKSFVVTNTGSATLSGLGCEMKGAAAGDYLLETSALPPSLEPGMSAGFDVTFLPAALGERQAELWILSDDSDENPFVVTLVGSAISPEIEVESPSGTALVSSQSGIDLGGIPLGISSAPRTVVVRNAGTAPLTHLVASIAGPDAADFQLDLASFQETLLPGNSAAIGVVFTPSVATGRSATLSIASNDADENPFVVSLAGSGQAPEVAVSESGSDLVSGTARLDFGAARTGTVGGTRTLTVSNTGGYPLANLSVAVVGEHAGDFLLNASDLPATLAPGASANITMSFTPTAPGIRSATLNIANDDADENPFVIALTGEGTAPVIAVQSTTAGNLVFGAATIDLGGTAVGSMSTGETITVTNAGTAPLEILAASLSGGQADEFALDLGSFQVDLAPGASTTIGIAFSPAAIGTRLATLSLSSDDGVRSPFIIGFTGRGEAPEIAVARDSGANLLNGVSDVSFQGSLVGETGSTETFTVTNIGNVPLQNLAVMLEGEAPGDFILDAASFPPSLPAGDFAGFSVTFLPQAAGARRAELHIASNDSDENPFVLVLAGTGLAPEIALETGTGEALESGGPSVPFGGVPLGFSSSPRTVVIRNVGSAPLLGISAEVLGADAVDFVADTSALPGSLAPGESTSLALTFSPTLAASRSATLSVSSNDSDENPFLVPLTGSGQAPEVSVSESGVDLESGTASLDFGKIRSGTEGTGFALIISNTGEYPLGNLSVSVVGDHAADYPYEDSGLPATLEPGGSASVVVGFAPTAAGMSTAELHIASDDADENPFVIALTGEGTAPVIGVHSATAGDLAFGAAAIDLGAVRVGASSAGETITLTNTGTAPLAVGTPTLAGANVGEFSLDSSSQATSLVPGASTSLVVTASPHAIGNRLATVEIPSDDVDQSPFIIALSVLGAAPEIAVTHDPATALFSGASGVMFQGVLVGEPGSTESFTVTNTGNVPLENIAASVTGEMAADFTLGGTPLPASLAPEESATFTVSFGPGAAGMRQAELRIASDDADENPFVVSLSGEGLAPEIAVESPAGTGLVSPVSDFQLGGIPLGFSSSPRTIVIRNDGTAPLAGISATLGGMDAADFSLDVTGLAASLAPGASSSFTVTFTPTVAAARTATLDISSNDSDENPFAISLTGSGQAPEIVVFESGSDLVSGTALLDFGPVRSGTAGGTMMLTVANTGAHPLANLSAAIVGANAGDFPAGTAALPTTLAPGASADIAVTFYPSAAGPRAAVLEIASDDADENPFTIALNGEGTAPVIAVSLDGGGGLEFGNASLDFGPVRVDAAGLSLDLTLSNTGTAPLLDLAAQFGGTHAGDFQLSPATLPASLAPGASTALTVTFLPTSSGARSASLALTSDDVDRNPFVIALGGTGEDPEIAITLSGTSDLRSGSTITPFAPTLVGETVPPVTFTVHNEGNVVLSGLSLALSGIGAGNLTIGGDPFPTSIDPGGSADFTLAFTATTVGGLGATLTVTSDDRDENPFAIGFVLVGVAPEITVLPEFGAPFESGVSTVNFGSIALGGSSFPHAIIIRNDGTASLDGISASLEGSAADDFSLQTPTLEASLAPGATTAFTVTCAPSVTGVRSAVLRITSDDDDENPFLLDLHATGIAPEIQVSYDGAELVLGNAVLDFGSKRLAADGVERSISISNIGSDVLGGLSVSIDGAPDFAVSASPPTTIAPGGSTGFTVSFASQAEGLREAVLRIESNDADESPFLIALRGIGIAPHIALSGPSGEALEYGAATVDFGAQPVGGPFHELSITVTNTGTETLRNLDASVSAGDFSPAGAFPASLEPGASAPLTLRFSAGATGPRSAILSITSDDDARSPFFVVLNGRGQAPEIAIEQEGSGLVSGDSVAFGDAQVGGTGATISLTLRNEGSLPLEGIALWLTGSQASDFSFGDTILPSTVPVGESLDFEVTFHPSAIGDRSAQLRIASNDGDENPFVLDLRGAGVAPEIRISGPSGELAAGASHVDFGMAIIEGTTIVRSFQVTNEGTAPLRDLGVVIGVGSDAGFSVNDAGLPASLAPGLTGSFEVRYSATAEGEFTGTVAVSSNDADEHPFTFTVSAVGRYPVNVEQVAYLKALNADSGDNFGYSVAISDDTLVVGAPFEDGSGTDPESNSGSNSGAVYVFERTQADGWQQTHYLKASGPVPSPSFGYSVAIDGETLVVGTPYDSDVVSSSGGAYVFRRNDSGQWTQAARLKAPNPQSGAFFGCSVAVSSETIAVGAERQSILTTQTSGTSGGLSQPSPNPLDFPPSGGAVFIYTPDAVGGLAQTAIATAKFPDSGDYFGHSISLSDGILVVGAHGEDGLPTGNGADNGDGNSGAAYVFERNAFGGWPQSAYLKGDSQSGSFGYSVAVDGDRIVVGDVDNNRNIGAAHMFQRSSGGWEKETKLIGAKVSPYDQFGCSVGISGETVVVGARTDNRAPLPPYDVPSGYDGSGAGYVFSLTTTGEWVEDAYVKASNANRYDYFGFSVAISAEMIAFGSIYEDGGRFVDNNSLSESGAAYIFNRRARPKDPEIEVSGPEGILVSGSATIDFGLAPAGSVGGRQYVTISNNGEAVLRDLAISILGGNAADFPLQTFGYPDRLEPGAVTSVAIGFQPSAQGSRNAELHITSSDAARGDFVVALTGTSAPPDTTPRPDIALELADGTLLSSLSSSVAFGYAAEGGSATRSFVLRNNGTLPLQGLALSFTGGSTEFSLAGATLPTQLDPGTSASFDIAFSPTTTGPRSVVLSIASNDADENPYQVVLRGEMEVVFADPNLEAAIRATLNLSSGPIPAATMETLIELDLSNLGLTNLDGLEYAINLKVLNLSGNNFPNPSPSPSAKLRRSPKGPTGPGDTDKESVWDLIERLGPFSGLYIDFLRPSGGEPPSYLTVLPVIRTDGTTMLVMVDSQNPPVLNVSRLGIDTTEPDNLNSLATLGNAGVIVETGFENLPPAAAPVATVTNARARQVTLDGSASADIDGFVVSWEWDWDGGGNAEGEVIAVQLPALVTNVLLTVTDETGTATTRMFTVDVVDAYLAQKGVPLEHRGYSEDYNQNGLPNLLDFAYGFDPARKGERPLLVQSIVIGGQEVIQKTGDGDVDPSDHFALWTVLQPEDSAGVSIRVDAAADLSFSDKVDLRQVEDESVSGGMRQVSYLSRLPIRLQPRLFVRVTGNSGE